MTNLVPISDSLTYCNYILPYVSRSFALGINSLKGQMRKNILIGYLLCRIADTIEDDCHLPSDKKCFYLEEFMKCFSDKEKSYFISGIGSELKGDPFHINLVKNTHFIFEQFRELSKKSQSILMNWIHEMLKGMIKFIKKYPLGIRISSITEYKEYCYFVAGTVGYMLTDLWKENGFFISNKRYNSLNQLAGIFGEGLQSINILKDYTTDLKNENAIFIPQDNSAENSIQNIIELAEKDLNLSLEYVSNLPRVNISIRFFCIFPLLLAFATLREIKKSSLISNPAHKIKISRQEAKSIYKDSYLSSFSQLWLKKSVKNIFHTPQLILTPNMENFILPETNGKSRSV